MTAPATDSPVHGPWNPGIQSQIPAHLLGLATLYRDEHGRVPLASLREIADLTGLPLRQLVSFRPERLALHELLVRVTANVSVPDGTRIEDLGISLRQITGTILERDVVPALPRIRDAFEASRAEVAAIVEAQIGRLYGDAGTPAATPGTSASHQRRGWLARLLPRKETPAAPRAPAPDPQAVVAEWEATARQSDGAQRAALRALARVAGALLVKHERLWADRALVARVATDIATNDVGSVAIGAIVEPLVRSAAAREGHALLRAQGRTVVMNTKGPSAAGKSTMRPLQKALAERLGVDWSQFALISPDIWRKQLLDYGSLGADYKYAGSFTGDELAIIDAKLDRYMAAKAKRGDVSHLLIDRFRFDSFAPDSSEAGSNLLTRFGQFLYLFFLVTPPAALVERAWNRGVDVGRYKAVDDTLAHAVEAYTGMPGLFFTWMKRSDKRVHVEFLDNSVPRGSPPRTAAYGWNDVLNVLDPVCLSDIERYQKIDVDAVDPEHLFPPSADISVAGNATFLRRCVGEFGRVRFAESSTGFIYLSVAGGRIEWLDRARFDALDARTRDTVAAVLDRIDGPPPPPDAQVRLHETDRVHTVGTWRDVTIA